MRNLQLPLSKETVKTLKAGDSVLLSGTILTARDCAHKRILGLLNDGKPLPFDLKDAVIYYAGPCPAKPDMACGSCGPTTSCRMDKYTPYMFDTGLAAQIGKGKRDKASIDAIARSGGVYFAAIGGAGAIYSKCVTDVQVIAYEDLGTEAIRRITVKDFPVIVAVDSTGKDIYSR